MIFENISYEKANRIIEEKVLVGNVDGTFTAFTQIDIPKGLKILSLREASEATSELPFVLEETNFEKAATAVKGSQTKLRNYLKKLKDADL